MIKSVRRHSNAMCFACLLCLLMVTPVVAQTEIDTKGLPFSSALVDRNGREIAKKSFFGEGTTVIRFVGNQELVLKDRAGNIIAGFEVTAVPNKKVPQLFVYDFDRSGNIERIVLEHTIKHASFRKGLFSFSGVGADMNFYCDEGRQTGVLKLRKIAASTDASDPAIPINRLVMTTEDGEEFLFNIEVSSRLIHKITKYRGDIADYLAEKGRKVK